MAIPGQIAARAHARAGHAHGAGRTESTRFSHDNGCNVTPANRRSSDMTTLLINFAGLGLIGLIVWWFWIARA